MKQRYEMTQDDLDALLLASRPTPCMYICNGISMFNTPQENANAAWKKLADKMGFIWDTVEPISHGRKKEFYAEPIKQGE